MSHSNPDAEGFKAHFDTLEIDAETLSMPGDATIVPGPQTDERRATLDTLPRLYFSDEADAGDAPADLEFLGTLGVGGMGLVRLARQHPLMRRVAVKTLKNHSKSAAEQLLSEAFVTGHLEHPNVVPVYHLGRDYRGDPVLVMKRVEGRSWLDLLHQTHSAHEDDEAHDLDWHLNTLLQVCNALRLAHSKGIIHRDLKPENVMVGNFGEVYLLDWGIAISTGDLPGLPRREDAHGLAGTPGCMAPEMTRDDASEIDERTDVFLLGALLHEILTGAPRHTGDTTFELMRSAYYAEPYSYDESIPTALGEIANRACAREKPDRYQSVDTFRDAIEAYLDHRESITLTEEASRRLKELQNLLDSEATETDKVHDVFGESRFGFQQALRMWPENEDAQLGLDDSLRLMIDFYLDHDNPLAAAALQREMHRFDPDIEARITQLRRKLREQEEQVEKLRGRAHDFDLRIAARSRSIIAFVLGIFWMFSALYWGVSPDETGALPELHRENVESVLKHLVVVSVLVLLFRKRVLSNAVNRRVIALLFMLLIGMATMRTVFWLDATAEIALVHTAEIILYIFVVWSCGMLTDLKIGALSIFFAGALVVSTVWPHLQNHAIAVADFLTLTGIAWIWWPRKKPDKGSPDTE